AGSAALPHDATIPISHEGIVEDLIVAGCGRTAREEKNASASTPCRTGVLSTFDEKIVVNLVSVRGNSGAVKLQAFCGGPVEIVIADDPVVAVVLQNDPAALGAVGWGMIRRLLDEIVLYHGSC